MSHFQRDQRVLTLALAGCASLLATITPGAASRLALTKSDARVEIVPPRGYELAPPDVFKGHGILFVHGAVCRTTEIVAPSPVSIHVERLAQSGLVVASVNAPIHVGALHGRGDTCAYYSTTLSWQLRAEESLRICASASCVNR